MERIPGKLELRETFPLNFDPRNSKQKMVFRPHIFYANDKDLETRQTINCMRKKTAHPIFILLATGLIVASCCVNSGDPVADNAVLSQVSLKLEKASIYITAKNTDQRLSKIDDVQLDSFDQPDEHFPTIMVDPKKTFQTIVGIGGAITDAAAITFYKLPKDKQEEVLNAYYDSHTGIGYSLCRTNLNSCDFSGESYAYSEVEGDTGLRHFTIEHDRKFKIPLIKAAFTKTGNKLSIYASPWSPPAWMKTNNDMLHGGKLKPQYYQTWANYYVRFVESYKQEGIPIWGLTVQNEPMATQIWESCIYTAAEEKDFIKNFLGPALHTSGLENINLIIWDHNRGLMYQRAQIVYDDPEASKYVWGTGFHWYTGDHYENVKLLHEAFPDKKILFTEGCNGPFDYNRIHDWQWGENYGEAIITDFNNSACGWTDWNILLDEHGGPNHVANYCYAPVIGNTETGQVIYMNSYYYLGHFSKFIRPGAKRVICSTNNDDLMATAMLNPDGSLAVVVMNSTENNMNYRIWVENRSAELTSPMHSIMTLVMN